MVPSPVRGGLGDTPAVFSAVFSVQHIATYLYNYNLSRYPNTPFSDICYKCTETISLDLLFRLQALAPTIDPLIPHNVKLKRYLDPKFSDIRYNCTKILSLDVLLTLQAVAPTIDPLIPHNVKLKRYLDPKFSINCAWK